MKVLKIVFIVLIFISFACKNDVTNEQLKSDNLLNATTWFQQSAEMRACFFQSFNLAKEKMLLNLKESENNLPKAVIVDIDETMLDNSPFEAYLIQHNIEYTKELWSQWVHLAIAEPLPGALEFAKYAEQNNVEVYYISNRSVNNFEPTMKNLVEKGFPFADKKHILLKSDNSDKSPRREIVAATHEIILYVGDNLRDFNEVFKDRSDNFGFKTVENQTYDFGSLYFILPNPMYGQWTKVYNIPNEKISVDKKIENMKESLKSYGEND